MKIERLSQKQLKIVLEKEDQNQYNTSYETFDYATKEGKEIFQTILNQATKEEKEEFFFTKENKILLEAVFDGKEFYFMITQLEKEEIPKSPSPPLIISLFSFENSEMLLKVAEGYHKRTANILLANGVYERNGRYFLWFCHPNFPQKDPDLGYFLGLVHEFGQEETASFSLQKENPKEVLLPIFALEELYTYFFS